MKVEENECPNFYRNKKGFLIARYPINWQELEEKVKLGTGIGRDLKTNESYNIHIDEVNSEWKSLDCFIKHTKFDVPYYINENGVKTTTGVYKKLNKEILFTENPYPYNLENGIMHYVLWSYHRNLSKIESLQIINEKFPSTEFEYLMFENSYTDKSVREIPHIQVFIRRKPLKGF